MKFEQSTKRVASTTMALFMSAAFAQQKPEQNMELPNLPNPYQMVENIVTMPDGRVMGSSNAINVDSKRNIWVFERCGVNSCTDSKLDPIMEFDPSGKFLRGFGGGMFVMPHAVVLDKEDNLWIVDAGIVANVKGSQIFKFSPDGKLLLTLGKPGIRGTAAGLFNQPSDLTIAPNGDIYVADGHIEAESNGRVVHLSKDGTFVEAWGTKGSGPLQFDCPHSIAIDSKGRIFVGDRTNNRIQILSPKGEFIAEWKQFGRPSGVRILDDVLYVTDSESRNVEGQYGYNPGWHRGIRIGKVSDGVVTGFIPDPSPHGNTSFPEGISVDKNGVIWGASVGDRKATKFVLAK
jgi:NHL repeat